MNKNYIKRAEEEGIAYANGMFSTFLKPSSQGENFSWNKFPDMCGGIARESLATIFSNDEWFALSDKDKKYLEDLCYKTTVKKTQELIKKN